MAKRKLFARLRLVFTLLTLGLSALLCWSAADLYLEGAALRRADPTAVIFSAEAVGEKGRLLLPAFGLWLVALIAVCACAPRRGEAVRKPPAAGRAAEAGASGAVRLRIGLFVLALLLIVLGVLNGGLSDVLVKAANICTECIGLG